jgi:hypothetical protein
MMDILSIINAVYFYAVPTARLIRYIFPGKDAAAILDR